MTPVRAALAAGDLGCLVTRLHEDVAWITAGDRPRFEGREAVSAALEEERAQGVCMDPRPVIDHQAAIVVKLRSDSGPGQGVSLHRVLRVRDDRVRRIEDFEDRESSLERAGALALSCPADRNWLATVCDFFGVSERRLEGLPRLIRRPEVPAKYGFGRRELIADSLGALHVPAVHEADSIADIGSGYGFPGLVLGAVLEADVSLVELAPERCQFLRLAVNDLGLRNVEVVESHVENLENQAFDVVTARNVARLNTMVEWAAPPVRLGGTALFWTNWTNGRDLAEEADGLAAAHVTGLELQEVVRTHPWAHWYVYVFGKVRETPSRFPRRLREARKRPITAGDAELPRDPVHARTGPG